MFDTPLSKLIAAAFIVLLLDQTTKAWVLARLCEGLRVSLIGIPLRRFHNRRAAVGRLRWPLLALWWVEFLFFAALVQLWPLGAAAPVAFGVALGGAGSNLLDRLLRDGVVDFIDFGVWPVFNLADAAIVAGVSLGIACA